MSTYKILPYSYKRAKALGVKIVPSKRGYKKIDVYSTTGKYITSIGDRRYLDYPNYVNKYGKAYALNRRKLYKNRHRSNTGKAGFYAENILW